MNYELQSVRLTTGKKKTYWTVVRLNSDLEEAGMNADLEDDKTAVSPVPPYDGKPVEVIIVNDPLRLKKLKNTEVVFPRIGNRSS